MACKDCEHFERKIVTLPDWGVCQFTPPATLAKQMGLESQYSFDPAPTHCEWCCSLFKLKDD